MTEAKQKSKGAGNGPVVRQALPDRINGKLVRGPRGVYRPTRAEVRRVLEKAKVPPEERIPYVAQGDELHALEIYRKIGLSAMLVGGSGVGKSMLAKRLAQRTGVPYLSITCSPDKTEGKMIGKEQLTVLTVEHEGRFETARIQTFSPSSLAYAALADIPVILVIDEIHKLRRNIDALLHPLTQERVLNLTDVLGAGEVYPLHPETMVIALLNPNYVGGGIENVGTAIRFRFGTIFFPYHSEQDKVMRIVDANMNEAVSTDALLAGAGRATLGSVPDEAEFAKLKIDIVHMCVALTQAFQENKKQGAVNASDTKAVQVKSQLGNSVRTIEEAPAPRLIVNALRAIRAGLDPATAVEQIIFNAITNDFGATVASLKNIAKNVYGIQ